MADGRFMLELDEDTKQVRLVWVFEDVYHAMLMHDDLEDKLKCHKRVNLLLAPEPH